MTYTSNNNSVGSLGIIALESSKDLAIKINQKIIKHRNKFLTDSEVLDQSYLVPINELRFSNGEGKVVLPDSVRGKDIYILCDVGNYSCTYNMYGFNNHKGPDEHFLDIIRTLSAIAGKANRVTIIMPLLYASRQHKRKGRESMDCSIALRNLSLMEVKNIITFDAHDPSIQNSIPLISFENVYATYDLVKKMLDLDLEMILDQKNLLVISPDTGAMDRALFYSGVLGVDIGLFYKRRDHSVVVNGKNPIVAHEYIGRDLEDKNVIIVDDMIASGESVFDIMLELKKRKVKKIYVVSTFALFTEGIDKFDKFYQDGYFDKVLATNLSYLPTHVKEKEWFAEVDLSDCLAKLIGNLNESKSIEPLVESSRDIISLIKKYKSKV